MDYEADANLTFHYHSQRELTILVESTSLFMVFSVVFSNLTHPDNFAVIIDFDNFTKLPTLLQERHNHGKLCIRKYISHTNNTNQTYICPYTNPKSSQNLAVLAEEVKEDIARYVSIGRLTIIFIQLCMFSCFY